MPFNMTVMGGEWNDFWWQMAKLEKVQRIYNIPLVPMVRLGDYCPVVLVAHGNSTAAASHSTDMMVEEYDGPGANLTTSRSIELLLDHIYRFGYIWIQDSTGRRQEPCKPGIKSLRRRYVQLECFLCL